MNRRPTATPPDGSSRARRKGKASGVAHDIELHGIAQASNDEQKEATELKLQVRSKGLRASSEESPEIGFINISNPEEDKDPKRRRQVRSHVLRNYHARRRRGQINVPIPVGKGKRDISSSPDPILARNPGRHGASLSKAAPRWCNSCNAQLQSNSCVHGRELQLVSSPESSAGRLTPGPTGLLGAGRVDPFASYPRTVSYDEHMLVDHFITYFAPLNDDRNGAEYARPLTTLWFPMAITDPIMFECLLRNSTYSLAELSPDVNRANAVLVYRGNVLRQVKEALSDPARAASDQNIAGLLDLMRDEWLRQNWDAYDQHAKALKLLIELRGGLHKLGLNGFLAGLALNMDLRAATARGSEPYFRRAVVPEVSLSIESLTSGFQNPEIFSSLSMELIGILNELCARSESLSSLLENQLLSSSDGVEMGDLFQDDLRLIYNRSKSQASALLKEVNVEGCICLAAEVYRIRIIGDHPPLALTLDVHTDLWELGSQISRMANWQTYRELLLWVAFIGSLTVRAGSLDLRWAQMMMGVAEELNVWNWEDARGMLKSFLWMDRRCEGPGLSLWMQVKQMRAANLSNFMTDGLSF